MRQVLRGLSEIGRLSGLQPPFELLGMGVMSCHELDIGTKKPSAILPEAIDVIVNLRVPGRKTSTENSPSAMFGQLS